MKPYGIGDLIAPIRYILDDHFGDLQNIELAKVCVRTPCAGRVEPSIDAKRSGLWEAAIAGNPVEIVFRDAQQLTHDDWSNSVNFRIGSGGIVFDGMTTTIPTAKLRGPAGLRDVRNKVQSLRVLLTLLNGGSHVEVDQTRVHFEGQERQPSKMSFLLRDFEVLSYGLGDGYHKARLAVPNALLLIGMEGVKRWFGWSATFENQHLLNGWLYSERSIGALMALEGLGRRLKRREDCHGDVYFRMACNTVLREFCLQEILNGDDVEELNQANNKLVKHIGDIPADIHKKHQRTLQLGAVLADFVVAYGILKDALGDLPSAIDDAWRTEIESAGEEHRKAKRDWSGHVA